MSKRRNENGQMRRDEYEAEAARDDDDAASMILGGEGFQRASDDALKKRKIVTARVGGVKSRSAPTSGGEFSFGNAPSTSASAAKPVATAAGSNPFQGFQGLTGAASTTAAAPAKPFAGFSGLTSTAPVATPVAAAAKASASTYQEAMEELNKEFLEFAKEQLKQNPSSKWTAAIQDYLRYAQEIETQFASTKNLVSTTPKSFIRSVVSNDSKNEAKKPAAPAFSFAPKPSTEAATKSPIAAPFIPSFGAAAPKPSESPASSSGSGLFQFNLPKNTASAPATMSGFSFGNSTLAPFSFGAAPTGSATNSFGASEAAKDEDEETVGREDPTVIVKADNPDEDCAFEAEKSKLYEWKKDVGEWADKGTNPLQVLVNKATKAARILVRNHYGKIVVNASLFKGMPLQLQESKGKKTGVSITLQVDGTLTKFLIKVNAARVEELFQALQANTPQ